MFTTHWEMHESWSNEKQGIADRVETGLKEVAGSVHALKSSLEQRWSKSSPVHSFLSSSCFIVSPRVL